VYDLPIQHLTPIAWTKAQIPILAPDYNKYTRVLPSWQAEDIHAMLFALHTDFSKGTAPVTSDGLLVVLTPDALVPSLSTRVILWHMPKCDMTLLKRQPW
jgi:hypothetical protein